MKNQLQKSLITASVLLSSIVVSAQWTSISPIPLGGIGNDGAVSFTIGSKGYVVAGSSANQTYAFDTITHAWSFVDTIPPTMGHAFGMAFAINGKGYVVGGDVGGVPQNTVWEFDPTASNHWTQKNNFTGGNRDAGFGFAINNFGYVGAGNDNIDLFSDIWKYNPSGDSWTQLQDSLPIPLLFPTSFVIGNKGFILTGGTNPAGVNEVSNMWCLDASNDSLTAKADFGGVGRQAAFAFSNNYYGYAGGGQTNFAVNLSDMWQYDPFYDQWTPAPAPALLGSAWSSTFVIGNTAYAGIGAKFITGGLTGNRDFFKFEMSSTTGINETKNQIQPLLYPNPASEFLTIQLPNNEKVLIEIYSSLGELVMQKEIAGTETFPLDNLSAGIYLVKYLSEDRVFYTRKIEVE